MLVSPRFVALVIAVGLLEACATGGVTSGSVESSSVKSTAMPLGRVAGPPPGFFDFCQRLPEECKRVAATPAVVELTPARRDELARVQSDVNRRITAIEDIDQYGWREHWTYPDTGSGDCEDFALEKRRALIAAGWPAQALFLAVARIPSGKAHTVLVAATSAGDFVLDNLKSAVVPWRRLPYAWKIRQSAAAPARWYLIPRG